MIILQLLLKQEECLPKASRQSAPWHILEPWSCPTLGDCCPSFPWLEMTLPIYIFLHSCYFLSSLVAYSTADHSNYKEETTKFWLYLFS